MTTLRRSLRALRLAACLGPALIVRAGVGPPILMPPFVVEEENDSGPDWIYGRRDGLEVLSGCPLDETKEFVGEIEAQGEALGHFIPRDILAQDHGPQTLILFPKSLKQTLDETMRRELESRSAAGRRRFTPLDDLRLSDPDSTYTFVVLDDWDWQTYKWKRDAGSLPTSSFVHTPAYVRYLIAARVPALPEWYIVGISRLYEKIDFGPAASDEATFEGETWISDRASSALKRNPQAERMLVPLGDLFISGPPVGKSAAYRAVWEAQAELFVRWALSNPRDGARRLATFVEGAGSAPTTEALFRSCFSMDYSDGFEALSDFLPRAVREQLVVRSVGAPRPAPMAFKKATLEQTRSIEGEWARRTLRAVADQGPSTIALYTEKTRRGLERDFARGYRDGSFLATLALFDLQTGNPKAARSLFDRFPQAAAARPIAALERANLELLDALKSSGPEPYLSDAPTAHLEAEIDAATRNAPAIEAAYLLQARICEHRRRPPTLEERRRLVEGARLFPRDGLLVVQCAAWDLRAGAIGEARQLIELSLWEEIEPSNRKKLEALYELTRPAPPAASPGNSG